MKKNIAILILFIIIALPVFSQVSFSGTADISVGANIAESGDYSSLLNPGNMMEIKDIGISSSIIARLDAGDEKTTFSAWLSLKEYPMGQALLTAAYGDPVQEGGVFELTKTLGDTIFSMDLMRLSANVYLSDNFSFEIGRQSMLTGYGYGWNPIDFANPLKNPTDPDAALRGVDGISFKIYMSDIASMKIYGILPNDILSTGLEYEEIKAGGEITFNAPGFEFKMAGFYDYDSTEGSDAYTPTLGTGFIVDIQGVGFYGEAAFRKGSRNYFTDGVTGLSRKDTWLISVLGGLEYTFSTETNGILEYFYNGEGLNKSERNLFRDSLTLAGPVSDLLNIYSPGYFAQHYIMLNIMQPFYDINTDINLSLIFSPDSGALTLMPSINYSFSGNLSASLTYVGMFDLYSSNFSEVSAMPVKHVINSVFTYSY